MKRRQFLMTSLPSAALASRVARPNFVWITCEDLCPHLGCYGDRQASTPVLDRLATQGLRYTSAFAHAGVCAPARSGLVTGMYPSSLGSHHMRCVATLPAFVKTFPELLRENGYFTGNVSKTDYNFEVPPKAWSGRGPAAHWRNRAPDQPFLYVVNLEVTHESKVRLPEKEFLDLTRHVRPGQRHDSSRIAVPPYHPDTTKVRREWARYYDMVSEMDYQAGEVLSELERDGLADDTIVFFFADNGTGLPRAKQFIFDSGMHVPLIVRFPVNGAHLAPAERGSVIDRLVSFVDFGPTLLSLAGIKPPAYMQGQPFLGRHTTAPRKYVHGIRDRMDERYDMNRSVRSHRFKYHRNYMPYLPHYPWLDYMDMLETSKEMRRLSAEGKLTGALAHFMRDSKPLEELYDIQADPHELRNLAAEPEHGKALREMREEHLRWVRGTIDLGFMPEQYMRDLSKQSSEYEIARSGAYPIGRILDTALLMDRGVGALPELIRRLADNDVAVRFWAANGLTNLAEKAVPASEALLQALHDTAPEVRIAAAQALCGAGKADAALPVLAAFLKDERLMIRVAAANVVDRIGEKARPILPAIKEALKIKHPEPRQGASYLPWLLGHAIRNLEPSPAGAKNR